MEIRACTVRRPIDCRSLCTVDRYFRSPVSISPFNLVCDRLWYTTGLMDLAVGVRRPCTKRKGYTVSVFSVAGEASTTSTTYIITRYDTVLFVESLDPAPNIFWEVSTQSTVLHPHPVRLPAFSLTEYIARSVRRIRLFSKL